MRLCEEDWLLVQQTRCNLPSTKKAMINMLINHAEEEETKEPQGQSIAQLKMTNAALKTENRQLEVEIKEQAVEIKQL